MFAINIQFMASFTLITFSAAIIEAKMHVCDSSDDDGGLTVPHDYHYRTAKHFKARRGHLQIFTSAKVACDGYLQSWRFIAMAEEIRNLHLGVFRRSENGLHLNLVNQTLVGYLNLKEINASELYRSWITVNLPEPFFVQRGDYLGIFYRRHKIPRKYLGIAAQPINGSDFAHTVYLFKEDELSLVNEEDGTFKTLDIIQATILHQQPALVALVTPYMTWADRAWPPMDLEDDDAKADSTKQKQQLIENNVEEGSGAVAVREGLELTQFEEERRWEEMVRKQLIIANNHATTTKFASPSFNVTSWLLFLTSVFISKLLNN